MLQKYKHLCPGCMVLQNKPTDQYGLIGYALESPTSHRNCHHPRAHSNPSLTVGPDDPVAPHGIEPGVPAPHDLCRVAAWISNRGGNLEATNRQSDTGRLMGILAGDAELHLTVQY